MGFDINITLAGKAGQGLVTISDLLLRVLARRGYNLFASQDYMSRVRGGHNFMSIRVSDRPVSSPSPTINILLALDQLSVDAHAGELSNPAIVIHDTDSVKLSSSNGFRDVGVPMMKIATEQGSPVYENLAALGVVMAVLGLEVDGVSRIIRDRFSVKGEGIVNKNLEAMRSGYRHVKETSESSPFHIDRRGRKGKMLINGAEAIGLGMIAGGVRFITAYPMSPSTAIFNFVTGAAKRQGIISEQAEDEIAAINMALGASAAGARSAVTTSGGGLALMVEAVSLAGIAEIPVVIADIQRPGPATGLPTRTAQEDLDFVLSLGHGEFPRFVFAPGNPEEAFHTTVQAFNLADKYQVPAFLLGDQHLVDSYVTMEKLNVRKTRYRSYLSSPDGIKSPYLRYKYTKSGVSPRLPHGAEGFPFITDCHVHEENGHISEEKSTASRMAEKRFLKMKGMSGEPFGPSRYGPKRAEITLVCWGSTYGAVKDTVDFLNERKKKAAMLHFNRIWPFPLDDARRELKNGGGIHVVENNIQGQFSRLLWRETGIKPGRPVLRYDGRPFNVPFILENLTEVYKWKL